MAEYQIVLILGIVLILLIMLDAYRRVKRKQSLDQGELVDHANFQENAVSEAMIETSTDSSQVTEELEITQKEKTETFSFNIAESINDANDETDNVHIFNEVTEENTESRENISETSETEEKNTSIKGKKDNWQSAIKAARDKRFRKEDSSQQVEEVFEVQESLNLESHQKEEENNDSQDHFLVFHIMAPRGYVFYGEDLAEVFDIRNYHRNIHNTYDHINTNGETLFTVINYGEPQTFGQIETIQTPGVTLYTNIKALSEPKVIFRSLLSEVHALAQALGGTLTNEHKRRFTQTDLSRYMAKIRQLELDQ